MAADNATTYTRRWCGTGEIAFLTLSSGTRLRYLKVGAGPSLLLLHTVRTQLDYFQRLIPKLTSHFTVYAVDLPGLGWSDISPAASYEEPSVRTAVVEFVEKLDLKDFTLAGESIGATLSLTASTQLSQVRNIVALNTYDYPKGVERANLIASIAVKAMRIAVLGLLPSKLENALILRGVMRGGFFDPGKFPEDFLAEQLRSGRRASFAHVECGYFRALPSYIAARRLYPRVNVPVTLIYGDHDWSKPQERDEVAQLVQGSRKITLAQSGHFGSLEHPDAIAKCVMEEEGGGAFQKTGRRSRNLRTGHGARLKADRRESRAKLIGESCAVNAIPPVGRRNSSSGLRVAAQARCQAQRGTRSPHRTAAVRAGSAFKLTERHHDVCRWICCCRPHRQSRDLQETCRSRRHRLQGARRIETRRVLGGRCARRQGHVVSHGRQTQG